VAIKLSIASCGTGPLSCTYFLITAAGQTFILYNDSVAPFPGGDPRNDYFTGDPDQTAFGGAPTTLQGFGSNTRTLMKIVVTSGSGDSVDTSTWQGQINTQLKNNFLTGNQSGLLYNNGDPSVPRFPYTGPPTGATVRQLTLNEDFDDYGRLIQTLGTTSSKSKNNQGLDTWGLPYLSSATENPSEGAVEVWQLFNRTGDTHRSISTSSMYRSSSGSRLIRAVSPRRGPRSRQRKMSWAGRKRCE
jgi:spore coat protein A